jgi:DNA replication and repair protein RecF
MLQKIKLTHFRSFEDKLLEFSPQVTVIVGPNAHGKTNILESISLLSTGQSFKATRESEMIQIGHEIARVKGKIQLERNTTLGVVLTTHQKKFLVNDIARRRMDFAGIFPSVLFGPWDMDIISGSPSLRRRFLDTVLTLVDREYRRSLHAYEKGLRQRNKLLYRMREEPSFFHGRSQLLFWDNLLIKNGDYISRKREIFLEYLNDLAPFPTFSFSVIYDKSAISEARLNQYAKEERAAATTLVGPHRDDFLVRENNRELARFGSRGEQRMAILWLKIGEMKYITQEIGSAPTLLLDDIFSELDHEHRDIVTELSTKQQTIITTADPHFIVDTPNMARVEL